MSYSQNGAAFFYWAYKRRKSDHGARRVPVKRKSFSDGMVVFLFALFCGFFGAAVQLVESAMLHLADLVNSIFTLAQFF